MSKKRSTKKRSSKQVRTSSKRTGKSHDPSRWLDRPSVSSENDALYKKIFAGLSVLLLILTVLLALGSGINGDDEYQNDYSEKLVSYYSTMGADTAALNIPKGNMHYYGGFFDIVTGFTNEALGYEIDEVAYHDVRHIYNALFGFLAMFFTALLAKEIAGWRAAILTLVMMFLSPRFLGHSLMNPKDIPFALGYIVAIYYMVRMFRKLPAFHWKLALGVTAGIALAIATRAGGLILVGILGLYAGLDLLQKYGFKGLTDFRKLGVYAAHVTGISIAALIIAVLFWPFALQDPFSHPFEALGEFSKLGVKIRVLFGGENTMSDQTSWDYALQWIWRTIPLFTLLGFTGSIFLLKRIFQRYQPLPVFMALFTAVFPLAYIIYKDSILHDGWRHLIFVYPTMVVMATLFYLMLERILQHNKTGRYALYTIVALLVLEPSIFIARNTAFPYTYFNPASGGISSAWGNYETDYWGVSVRQALEWMEDEGILRPDMQDTITIASSFVHNVRAHLGQKYKGHVRVIYQRFNNRYERPWDYGIFPSRYIRGPHLRKNTWPNSRAVHVVKANGVPLTAVEKGGGPVFDAEAAFKRKDFPAAIALFRQELEQYPDNEQALLKLVMSYASSNNFSDARTAANQLLEVVPDNTNALLYRGVAALNTGDVPAAEADLRRAIEIEPAFGSAYYYLALIQNQRQDISGALESLQKALQVAPRFKPAYELLAQIYEQQGDTQRAQQVRAAAASF